MLFKEIDDGRTHGRTDEWRRTLKDHKSSLSTSCSGELKTYRQNNPLSKIHKNCYICKQNKNTYKIVNHCSCISLSPVMYVLVNLANQPKLKFTTSYSKTVPNCYNSNNEVMKHNNKFKTPCEYFINNGTNDQISRTWNFTPP